MNGDRVVDMRDRKEVKSHLHQNVDQTNFRDDVATSAHSSRGFINNADVKLVEREQGTSLP